MLFINDRVPGQLLPVGAKFNYNAGAPLDLHADGTSGLGFTVLPAPKRKAKQFFPKPLISVNGLGGSPDGLGDPMDEAVKAGRALGYVLLAVSGYFVGKAMAPNQKDRGVYAAVGAVNAAVFGPLGLGVQALYSMKGR